jgi:hypothetical protein
MQTYQNTPEEEAYERLLEEKGTTLSEAARNAFEEAAKAAYKWNFVQWIIFDMEEYWITEKTRLAAAGMTAQDRETLAELARASSLAALSIDSDDETPVARKVERRDIRKYHEMLSDMLNELIQEGAEGPIRASEE